MRGRVKGKVGNRGADQIATVTSSAHQKHCLVFWLQSHPLLNGIYTVPNALRLPASPRRCKAPSLRSAEPWATSQAPAAQRKRAFAPQRYHATPAQSAHRWPPSDPGSSDPDPHCEGT